MGADCDIVERCTGASADCPADVLVAAGTPCGSLSEVNDLRNQCHEPRECDGVSAFCAPSATLPDGSACDDGDFCTRGETCRLGACGNGAFVCECRVDADCAAAT